MTKRKLNILDKIGSLIPGYKGYANREGKRNDDKKLRGFIALELELSENEIIQHQQSLIRDTQIQTSKEWEIIRKSLNTITTKIKNASYGESSLFNDMQIKEDELDEIYTIDLELYERVSLIRKTINIHINEVSSPLLINHQIQETFNILQKRINFINKF
jgi:hypothetical protein